MRKILMEYPPCIFDNISSRWQPRQASLVTPAASPCELKMVRLAGFWRLHPIVPDRTAFGTANEDYARCDNAENQCQSPEHDPRTPIVAYHRAQSLNFSSRTRRWPIGQAPGLSIIGNPVTRN
jgi:hypothetical protein